MSVNAPNLVVMLTHHDRTVEQAFAVFEACKNTKAKYWGFKEEPLPLGQMKELAAYMRECGKVTTLEVVAYTEKECVEGARRAVECGVDYLMGTMYFDEVRDLCHEAGIRYMPFVGKVTGRPSVLDGTLEGMIEEASRYVEKGVDGIDLLGYRYTGDAVALNKGFVRAMSELGVPVCLAGSVNSVQRLDEVKDAAPWAFTIGGAFFEHAFGKDIATQIDKVCEYMCVSGDGSR